MTSTERFQLEQLAYQLHRDVMLSEAHNSETPEFTEWADLTLKQRVAYRKTAQALLKEKIA